MKTILPARLPLRNSVLFKFLLIFCFIGYECAYSQSESNNMITYDTTYLNSGITWTFRITRPADMFTANSPDTASRPAILSMPGIGEVGTNPSYLVKYGPHYWLKNGWDGGVQLGNGKHYPILITIITDATNVRPGYVLAMMYYLLDNYHIKRNSVHVAGLSMGGFTWGRFICYAASAGDERAMSLVKSYTSLEGVANDNFSGYNMPGWTAFGQWAKKYGGKFFGLEGTNDTRNVWNVRDAMEATVPNSAYFSYQNLGGGAHCCWNSMYDPSVTDWQCVPTITSPIIATNSLHPNSMGTYTKGENIFQWMLRQGDTTLVSATATPSPSQPPTVNAGAAQTIQLPVGLITLTGTASANGGNSVSSVSWAKTSGPACVVTTPLNLVTTITGLNAGTYIFTLTAKDNAGQVSSSAVTITVNGILPAAPPTVQAGGDQTITLPTNTATLTGTASGNAGAGISGTSWTLVSGPNLALITSPNNTSTTITGLAAGVYIFKFKATDSNNISDSATVQVAVNNPAPPPATPPASTGKVMVGEGEYQVYFIDQDKTLWGLGRVTAIGVGGKGKVGIPQKVKVQPGNLKFKYAAGGLHDGAAVDENGYVWTMGANDQGQLGIGNKTTTTDAQKITVDNAGNPFTNVQSIVAFFSNNSDNGFFAVKDDGTLWAWGQLLGGMRGNGTDDASSIALRPVQIVMPGDRRIKQIVAGNFALALCTDGTVWTWGPTPSTNLGYSMSGNQYQTPHQLTQLSGITQIAGGAGFNYALGSDHVLYGWGQYGNYMGNSSVGNIAVYTPTPLANITNNLPAPIAKIVTNSVCTHAILTDGSLWGWGDGAQGNIGNGQEVDFSNPANGLYAWNFVVGQVLIRYPYNVAPTIKFTDVFGSTVFTFYTYALDENGQLYCWGRNKTSVLANGIVSPNSAIDASYANAWDVKWPQKVDPFALAASGKTWISTCPLCVVKPSGTDCATYPVPANTRPTANAGSNQNITTSTTTLDGSGSTDNVHISYYEWKQIAGPSQAVIDLPGNAVAKVYGLVTGVYKFQLRTIDNGWLSDSTIVEIAVNAGNNKAPIANAGTDQTITLPVNSTTLDGSGSSDSDGLIASYTWTRISGPNQFNIANISAASTTIKNLVAGTYSFQLKVTDNAGAIALDTVSIVVKAAAVPNEPPIANAGGNITITLPASTANLNGSASKDQDGSITAYAWSQTSGPSTAVIVSAATASTGLSGLQQGVYVFTLKVTDNNGATASDAVTVTVNAAANKPPVANAGGSKAITLPTNSVTLDGSLSADPDGSITTYSWTQVSGPSASALTGGSTAIATADNLIAGQYIFQLTVTDDKGATGTAQVKITVVASGVQPPIANAGANQTITLPTNSATIDGSGSIAPSGSISGYVWKERSGPSAITLTNTAQNVLNNLVAGRYAFYLTITDNAGNSATDSVIITVNAAVNIAPVADAGSGISMTLPVNSATLDGSKSYDPDGTINTYSWTKISGPNAPVATGANTATLNLSALIVGQYIYQLTVTDNSGASSTSQVKISVAEVPNIAPYADAGEDQTITLPASSVNLDGSASYDPDGSIATYSWVKISGPGSITISNSNTATPAVVGLQTGSYIFELTITDDKGATAKDQVIVTVNPKPIIPNQLPIANAGSNITIAAPESSISLNGNNSFDPDGTLSGYSWKQISGPSTSVISGGTTVTPAVSQLIIGQYVFELTVTDNNGATDKDQVTVTVNPAVPKANQTPIADAGSDTSISLPVNVYVLDGTHSSDPDGTIVSYQWLEVSGPNSVTSSTMDNSKVSIGDLQAGEYTFQLTVTDNGGISSTANIKLTVTAGSGIADQLLIYPNPAHDVVNGKISSTVTGTTKINIYDMNGKLVISNEAEKTGDVLDKAFMIDRLAKGMYMIQVNIANRKTMVAKFIKN